MSHISVNSVLPAEAYNRLIIDHDATEKAEAVNLKQKYLPSLLNLLATHGVADLVEPHLLHRHFSLREGEVLVHKQLDISGSGTLPDIRVDVAKAMACPKPIKPSLVPLLWMASPDGSLIAYEYGLKEGGAPTSRISTECSTEQWTAFAHDFANYVNSAGIADILSLKDKSCVTGGEYVVPGMRALFRVPSEVVNLQHGSDMLESGWGFDSAAGPDAMFPECTDGHVTKTRQTSGGTVAHYHDITEDGVDSFNEKEVASLYTDVMWSAVKSEKFWAIGGLVSTVA